MFISSHFLKSFNTEKYVCVSDLIVTKSNIMKRNLLKALLFISLTTFIGCKKEIDDKQFVREEEAALASKKPEAGGSLPNNMVLYWNQKSEYVLSTLLSGEIEIPNPQLEISNYFFAIIQIAVHDALNSITPKYDCYALKNIREKRADPNAAVASAAYHTIKHFKLHISIDGEFPIDEWYTQSLATIPDGESKDLGVALGEKSSDAIINAKSNDNYFEARQSNTIWGSQIGEYRSTPFPDQNNQAQVYPYWTGFITPFSVQSFDQFLPNAPYAIISDQYAADYNEVKILGHRANPTRTPEQTEMSQFWEEKSPVKWNRFARAEIQNKNMDAWKTARLLAILNTALVDAFSSSFKAKYHFYYWRPETAIWFGNNDGNPNTDGGFVWETASRLISLPNVGIMFTPHWPEYPSEQSAFSGAAAEVFRLFFGTDVTSVDQTSIIIPGTTRHYSKFSQAATDNSESQLFLGYDFRNSIEAGENMGKQIANYVFTHNFR